MFPVLHLRTVIDPCGPCGPHLCRWRRQQAMDLLVHGRGHLAWLNGHAPKGSVANGYENGGLYNPQNGNVSRC